MQANDMVIAAQAEVLLKEAERYQSFNDYSPALKKFEEAYILFLTLRKYREKDLISLGLLLMNWSGVLTQIHEYKQAILKAEESWSYLTDQSVINEARLDLARANLLSNMSGAYLATGQVDIAYQRLELSDRWFSKRFGDQPSIGHCMMFMHWAMALEKEHRFSDAIEKYHAAFLRWPGIRVAEKCHENELATLYLNWGIALNTLDMSEEALQKLNQAWIIRGKNLALDPKFEIGRVKILSSLANVYSKLQQYEEAGKHQSEALRRLDQPRIRDTAPAVFERTIILLNRAGDHLVRLDAETAISDYEAALLIVNDEEARAKIHSQLGLAYLEQKNFARALQLLLLSRSEWENLNSYKSPQTDQLGETCINLSAYYLEINLYKEALDSVNDAIVYFKQYAKARGLLFDANLCSAMLNKAIISRNLKSYKDALVEIESAIEYLHTDASRTLSSKELALLYSLYICAGAVYFEMKEAQNALSFAKKALDLIVKKNPQTEEDEIATSVAWTQIANASQMLHRYGDAADGYAQAVLCRPQTVDKSRLVDDLALIYGNWARSLYMADRDFEAIKHFQKSFDLLNEAPSTPDRDQQLFTLVQNWQSCRLVMDDYQSWAKKMSHALRARLTLILKTNSSEWISDLHNRFMGFHVQWMKDCLAHDLHTISEVLSLVSGWRMGQALLDEQIRDDPTKPEPVRQFCRARHNLDQLRHRIKAIRSNVEVHGVVDLVKSAALEKRYIELNHLYDAQHAQLITLQTEAAQYPEFSALSGDFGSYGEQLRFRLEDGEAIAFLVDFSEQDFRGILLLSRDKAQWFNLADPVEGINGLQYYNWKYAKGRGFRGHQHEIGSEAVEPVPPAFIKNMPPHLRAGQFWTAFGQWIEMQLWLPLKNALQEQKITHLNLITQGRTHSLPWEMNAPAHLKLNRFPSGALFAMHKGLVPRPQFSFKNEMHSYASSLGLAASRDSNIPCAAMEIELIKDLWTGTVYSPYDYLSPPANGVVAGHFSGHGVYRDDTPQQAYLEMGSTPWTVPEMMSSRIHPKRIFLSACVAGRTTETGEGDLYGFVTGLMQCGVQELSAATLNMDDMWMLALAINVQRRLHDDPKLTQGEALAQAKIALGKGELVTQEVKHAWFNALMSEKIGFDRNIVSMLRNLDQALEQNALQPYAGYLEINTEASKNWLSNITRETGFIARQTMISKTADTIPWRTVPPQPILGSLLHAVLHFG